MLSTYYVLKEPYFLMQVLMESHINLFAWEIRGGEQCQASYKETLSEHKSIQLAIKDLI